MSSARDIMHAGVECVPEMETLDRAAQMMRDRNVGSLPICGSDNRLKGIITDRDIVVKCVAHGLDPSKVTAAEMAQGRIFWVEADADEDEVIKMMQDHKIRRLPVMDDKRLVGMISEADLATHISEEKLARYCNAVYSAPPSM
ncbi:hypoxic response protein 1 [Longispora fulva]|uniref:CBS domain-containing protein n=1 Tax=Longispora fulva TaxID=619741 RepID=A0A8J7KN52_9ACTN|nr:CBS domain-containing protein [Longispora fulva]MBG6141244.1 CBS domain-containing protein [Longispora fulva]GIG62760.1 hypoxic response protein 1 [Longispora fulva]